MLTYTEEKLGKIKIKQKENVFEIEIRKGNCLAVFIHVGKNQKGETTHTFYNFYADEQHLKNIIKNDKKIIYDEVLEIELNMAYKECYTLLKYFVNSGYEVKCKNENINLSNK